MASITVSIEPPYANKMILVSGEIFGEVHSAFSVLLAVEHLVVVRKAPALWKYLGEKNILGRWEFSRFPTSRQVPPLEA